jgi:hypothetical protein
MVAAARVWLLCACRWRGGGGIGSFISSGTRTPGSHRCSPHSRFSDTDGWDITCISIIATGVCIEYPCRRLAWPHGQCMWSCCASVVLLSQPLIAVVFSALVVTFCQGWFKSRKAGADAGLRVCRLPSTLKHIGQYSGTAQHIVAGESAG